MDSMPRLLLALVCLGCGPQASSSPRPASPPSVLVAEAECAVRVMWDDDGRATATATAPSADEATRAAFADACAQLFGRGSETCYTTDAVGRVWSERREGEAGVTVEAHVVRGGRREATASAPDHTDACRAAARDACPEGERCSVLEVGGVPVALVLGAEPSADYAHPPGGRCVVAIHVVTREATGTGEGETQEAAEAAARAAACDALGERSCEDEARYELTRRGSSLRVTNGDARWTVEGVLAEVARAVGEAESGASRVEACLQARAAACAQLGCAPGDARVDLLDGVDIAPAPRGLAGFGL